VQSAGAEAQPWPLDQQRPHLFGRRSEAAANRLRAKHDAISSRQAESFGRVSAVS
jgi:hypothetical protein